MEILKHRSNSISDVNHDYGLEIDLRDFKNKLVLAHDHPNEESIKFDDFLEKIHKNQLLAINIKSTEIEDEIKSCLDLAGISNYFIFDWAIPSMLKGLDKKLVCAFRLSEFEKDVFPQCDWIWMDSFHKIWYDSKFIESLKDSGYKISLVSPELHGRESEMLQVKEIVNSVKVDAICTDMPDFWLND